MPNPVTHFEIIGKDAIALQKFYAEVFDWRLGPPMVEMGNYSLITPEPRGIGGGIGAGDPRVTFYIEVGDPQACLDQINRLGGKTLMPATTITKGVTIALFQDPAGNTVGLTRSNPERT